MIEISRAMSPPPPMARLREGLGNLLRGQRALWIAPIQHEDSQTQTEPLH